MVDQWVSSNHRFAGKEGGRFGMKEDIFDWGAEIGMLTLPYPLRTIKNHAVPWAVQAVPSAVAAVVVVSGQPAYYRNRSMDSRMLKYVGLAVAEEGLVV